MKIQPIQNLKQNIKKKKRGGESPLLSTIYVGERTLIMKTFAVNGKEYKAKAFDFNLVCDLEDMGISFQESAKKPMSMVRAYFGLCAGKGKDYAGKEMEAHIISGGSFEDIMEVMSDEMEKSDFFRNLNKKAEQKGAESTEKTSEKTE